MKTLDIIKLSALNVFRGRLKSFLCAASVCVGICSVCTIIGLGRTATTVVGNEINRIGIGGIAFYVDSRIKFDMDPKQVKDVKTVAGVKAAMPLSLQTGKICVKERNFSAAVCGVDGDLKNVFNITLLYGRLPGSRDISSRARVAVIDNELAKKTYKRENIIGKKIVVTIGNANEECEIIGVISSQKQGIESLVGNSLPNFLYMPYSTVNEMAGKNTVDKIAVSCVANINQAKLTADVASKLKSLNGIDFLHENLQKYADGFKSIASAVTLLATAVGGISILVGGIGVMNSMVSSVENRKTEIGIYMALGAQKHDILRCFLFEAIFICILGGIVGCAISAGAFTLINLISPYTMHISAIDLTIGIAGATACGAIFGILPAYSAASLNPINSIRE